MMFVANSTIGKRIDLSFLPDLADPTDLRIPGPTPLPPEIIEALGRPMIPHRGALLPALYTETLRLAREAHRTDGEVLTWPGTGSAGWEVAIVNLLEPGDPVLATVCGDFGDRFANVGTKLGLDVRRLDVPWGEAVTPSTLRDALNMNPDVKAVFLTHNETSTAITNPLPELAAVVRDHGALVIVDSVSGAAALPLETDAWGLDVVLSGSQKAWMCPPGLLIVAFGQRALTQAEWLDGRGYPRFSFDLMAARKAARIGITPATPPLTMIYAFRTALELLMAEGMDNVWARHARLGAFTRTSIQDLGLRLFANPDHASNTVTAFYPPEGMTASALATAVRESSGIDIAVGQADYADRINRIGHLGWVHEPELAKALTIIGNVIRSIQ